MFHLKFRGFFSFVDSGQFTTLIYNSPTPYPIPHTLYLAPCTLHPIPYTLYPVPCTLHPVPITQPSNYHTQLNPFPLFVDLCDFYLHMLMELHHFIHVGNESLFEL